MELVLSTIEPVTIDLPVLRSRRSKPTMVPSKTTLGVSFTIDIIVTGSPSILGPKILPSAVGWSLVRGCRCGYLLLPV